MDTISQGGCCAPPGDQPPARRKAAKKALCLLGFLLLVATPLWAAQMLLGRTVSGGCFYYIANKGDSFASLSARYGVDSVVLARANGLRAGTRLRPGYGLWIDNRHIVPADIDDGILINVPQRMLFVLSSGHLVAAYPVSVGRAGWRTPRGEFEVVEKRKNPVWRVPPSIQAEMAAEGKRVRTVVPPGPNNPLGKYWVGLSLGAIGCHGTIAPLSIYNFRTHGCIRLHPDDAAALYSEVGIGTPGEIVYQPLMMTRLADGRIFLEANPNIYGLKSYTLGDLQALAQSRALGNMVDWRRVNEALERRDGLARDVTIGRTRWWQVMPLELRGLGPLLSGEESSVAGNCSGSEQ